MTICNLSKVRFPCFFSNTAQNADLPIISSKIILDAGFADAVREDMSEWFVEILNMEIEKLKSMKDEFLEHHSMQDYLDLENGWLDKVRRVQSGVQSVSFDRRVVGKIVKFQKLSNYTFHLHSSLSFISNF